MATEPGEAPLTGQASVVRQFNRFYTQQFGFLGRNYLGTRYSVTQARVLYELGRTPGPAASQLAERIAVDPGYLSRLLSTFEREGLIVRSRARHDRRQRPLRLTGAGRRQFDLLNSRSQRQAEGLLRSLGPADQGELVRAMATVERLLRTRAERRYFVLREPRAGDLGWVVQRHGALYAQEYGLDRTFEGLVAEIVSDFVKHDDPRFARCWIAEADHQNVGCVFVVRRSARVAQLRLLLVDPCARGCGLGRRLVDQCVEFARMHGYRKLVLWTNDVLHAAARLYKQAGFRMVAAKKHRSFGRALVGQTWELDLRH